VQGLQPLYWTEQHVVERLEQTMVAAFDRVLRAAQERDLSMRSAAMVLAVQRVADALMTRGIYP
jgi:glutamate dehydrogenase (NAD(P)+)